MSLALTESVKARLEKCAEKTDVKPHTLSQAAILAAIEAIEEADYRVVFPLKFRMLYEPKKAE